MRRGGKTPFSKGKREEQEIACSQNERRTIRWKGTALVTLNRTAAEKLEKRKE